MKEVPFSEAMRRKYPEWVVLITTIDEAGKANVMPAGWAMVASHQPPLFAVSVGHTRYTHQLIRVQREFVIAFPGPGLEEAITYTGSCSGREVDKFKESGLTPVAATKVKPPLLAGCVVNLECTLTGELEAGDHTIFLGRVVAAHVDERVPGRLVNFGGGKFALSVPQE
ncbi:MAG TPA: flavin reductase family protein [Armatimonadetes bacterium]|nr:flavin reductase family protein [Armatimonadota bacterium]